MLAFLSIYRSPSLAVCIRLFLINRSILLCAEYIRIDWAISYFRACSLCTTRNELTKQICWVNSCPATAQVAACDCWLHSTCVDFYTAKPTDTKKHTRIEFSCSVTCAQRMCVSECSSHSIKFPVALAAARVLQLSVFYTYDTMFQSLSSRTGRCIFSTVELRLLRTLIAFLKKVNNLVRCESVPKLKNRATQRIVRLSYLLESGEPNKTATTHKFV